MFRYPNYTFLGYNFSDYPKSSLFKAFDKTQVRLGYGDRKSMSFHQFFKEYKGLNIEYCEELSQRDLGINANEVKRESSLTFHKYLNKGTSLFPFHTFTDSAQELFLKVGFKSRCNNVDTNKASGDFMKHALNQDKLFAMKFGYFGSHFKDLFYTEGSTNEVSGEYCTDQLNSNFVHLKAHHRRFTTYGNYFIQAHAKYDKLIGLSGHKDFSVNDTIMLRNFKGVKDVGRKYYKEEGGNVCCNPVTSKFENFVEKVDK
jgi:hypothetical protein